MCEAGDLGVGLARGGGRVKRTCGSGEELTPLPMNRFLDGGSPMTEQEFSYSVFFYS